jgi:hypothetical protein
MSIQVSRVVHAIDVVLDKRHDAWEVDHRDNRWTVTKVQAAENNPGMYRLHLERRLADNGRHSTTMLVEEWQDLPPAVRDVLSGVPWLVHR